MNRLKDLEFWKMLVKQLILNAFKAITVILNFHFFLGYTMGGRTTLFKYLFSVAYIIGGAGLYFILHALYTDLSNIFPKLEPLSEFIFVLFIIEIVQYTTGFISASILKYNLYRPRSTVRYYIICYLIAFSLIPIKTIFYTHHNIFTLLSEVSNTLHEATPEEQDALNKYFLRKLL